MNKYDNDDFFGKYQEMARSKYGLKAAGEWTTMKTMLPDFKGKRVLDIGCGYGWHCFYALEQGASLVVGIDSSYKMLQVAKSKAEEEVLTADNKNKLTFKVMSMEDMDFPENSFDVVISSLAFHYVQSFDNVVTKVASFLNPGGDLVFSVEHPIFTSYGTGDWIYNKNGDGKPDHWPVDRYFDQGLRTTNFLGCEVIKYHKTLTTYINTLITNGLFQITKVIEPLPEPDMLATMPDEARRPMMLLIAAKRL